MTNIAMGQLTDEQEAIVRQYVAGYNVHDIGAGQLGLSKKLLELGAHTVTALDKDYNHRLHLYQTGLPITLVGETFEEYARHGHFIDVAFVSWPETYQQFGIVQLLRDARITIYLGSNFDGTACGSKEMFEQLVMQEVLATVPHRWNTLIVYGNRRVVRRPLMEELAALRRDDGPPYAYSMYGDPLEDFP